MNLVRKCSVNSILFQRVEHIRCNFLRSDKSLLAKTLDYSKKSAVKTKLSFNSIVLNIFNNLVSQYNLHTYSQMQYRNISSVIY